MEAYFIAKTLHIISSVLMVGTGLGSAIYFFFANRWGDLRAKQYVAKMVVKCDWIITTPTVIVQPLTGYWMMQQTGWTLTTPWIASALIVYALVGMAWLPVVWLQIRMSQLLDHAVATNSDIDHDYHVYRKWWEFLGYIGFSGAMFIFYLMVSKVGFWGD